MNNGAMLNAYPDSLGGTLLTEAEFLGRPECENAFRSFYILPSLFNSDLDRGFSIASYDLNPHLADEESLQRLKLLGLDLKLDFVLNHLSVLSPQFQDILTRGKESPYADFFIDWNKFWAGKGQITEEGYIMPDEAYIKNMFFRKPGLPLLMVHLPDGQKVPYWNTFYQEVRYPSVDGREQSSGDSVSCQYLGQMDLNLKSPLVWAFYQQTLEKLAAYGAAIVRLDAFAYAPKEPGRRNFMNEPETWELLEAINTMAKPLGLELLPEIHAAYEEGAYMTLAQKGYVSYDFFLPGLLIDAIENHSGQRLACWAEEIRDKNIRVVNMLGCHDGIPMLDLKGMLSMERIQQLINLIVSRGGLIKNLHGQKNMYYQVNATYYSALGEDDRKMLLARALQLYMPGKPQIWYLDLFAERNNVKAAAGNGEAGHKEINRTNLTAEDIQAGLKKAIVQNQLQLLRMRNTCSAFDVAAKLTVEASAPDKLILRWEKGESRALLEADLSSYAFNAMTLENGKETVFGQ